MHCSFSLVDLLLISLLTQASDEMVHPKEVNCNTDFSCLVNRDMARSVFYPRCRLVEDLRLFQTDF